MVDRPDGPPQPSGAPGLRVGGAAYPAGPPEHWPAYGSGGAAGWDVPPRSGTAPAPPPPGDGSGRMGGAVAIAVAVVAVVALTIVGVGTLVATSGDGAEATGTTVDLSDPEITAPPSEEPIAPTMPSVPGLEPDPGVDPEARARPLEEVLPDLVAFVEETRGQRFVTEPVVDAVPDDEFARVLAAARADEEAAAEERGESAEDLAVAATALGLLPPGFDPEAASGDLDDFVLGFYDPDSADLYVRGDQVTPFVQSVVVHELTHALDDQIHDLSRLDDLLERPDESAFAFLALVEGTASHVQAAFEAQLSPDDVAAFEAEQYRLALDQLPSAMGLPPVVLVQSQVPYVSGKRFVDTLVAEGGMAAVDAAYEAPPTTSEQILDPAVFAAGEGPVALRPLEVPGGGDEADRGAFGAADLRLLDLVSDPIGTLIDPDVGLLEPVDGFGGGQYVSWVEGGRSCISVEAVGDDAAGSMTIQAALETWASSAPGAEVSSRVGGSGATVVTALRCG